MIDEGWIIKDLEGNGPGLIDMLFRHWPGESEENQDIHGWPVSQPEFKLRTSRLKLSNIIVTFVCDQ
jgi:hypothetical protein